MRQEEEVGQNERIEVKGNFFFIERIELLKIGQ